MPKRSAFYRNKQFQPIGILAVLLVAAIGTYLLAGSHAASPYGSAKASDGSPGGAAVLQQDNSVQFGAGSTRPACTITLNPGANIASAESSAPAGAVICLSQGTYETHGFDTSHGTAAQPITVTSADYAHPAVIDGRLALLRTATYLNINHLKFTWNSTYDSSADTVALDSANVNFTYNDVSGIDSSGSKDAEGNTRQTICINPGAWDSDPSTGKPYVFANGTIDHNLIHDCGDPADPNDQIHAQGVYMSEGASNNVVSNNWCWNVAARCYQIRGGSDNIWRNNVANDANWGFLFGDLTPNNNDVYNNVVGPDVERLGQSPPPGTYGYGGSLVLGDSFAGTGNSFHDNCVESAPPYISDGSLTTTASSTPGAVLYTNNTVAKVQFVDAAHHNYSLSSAAVNNPCRSYGVQSGGDPGP